MSNILKYEMRRVIGSKLFIAITAICLFYGWLVLSGNVVLGVANTAPFSAWSFGSYLAQMVPLLTAAMLLFLWNQFSRQVRRLNVLTDATPADKIGYVLVKCGAAAAAWLLLALLIVMLGVVFLVSLFGSSVAADGLLGAAALVLIPALVFVLGLGMVVVSMLPGYGGGFTMKQKLVAAVSAVCILIVMLPFTYNLTGGGFYSEYPLTLKVLDPVFRLPPQMVWSRAAYAAAGLAALAFAVLGQGRSRKRA